LASFDGVWLKASIYSLSPSCHITQYVMLPVNFNNVMLALNYNLPDLVPYIVVLVHSRGLMFSKDSRWFSSILDRLFTLPRHRIRHIPWTSASPLLFVQKIRFVDRLLLPSMAKSFDWWLSLGCHVTEYVTFPSSASPLYYLFGTSWQSRIKSY
jgi:hypothetical protein